MVEKFIKNEVKGILLRRKRRASTFKVLKILKKIEINKGQTNPKSIRLCTEYAEDILGSRNYAPWLYVYSAMAETFKEGWIPDNYYSDKVLPILNGNYGRVSLLKPLSQKLFSSNHFPDIGYYLNGLWFSENYEIMNSQNAKDYLFKDREKIVYKLENSAKGKGVFIFNKESFDIKNVAILGNGVFQAFIKQHSFFSSLMPNSVVTLRLTTYRDENGIVSVKNSFLRTARTSDQFVQSLSDVRIPIDIMTGHLDSKGYIDIWSVTDKHPDTDVVFANEQIPHFDACVKTVLKLHKSLPHSRIIGWDLVVDHNNEVQIMEWNGSHPDIKFCEATQGPCFANLGWEKLNIKSIPDH